MTLIDQHTNTIHQLCSLYHVERLYAFGSALTKNFNKYSDVDFIVKFKCIELSKYADNYYDFKFALEETLHRSVDLLEEQAIRNPFFKQAIEKQRQLIYGH